MIPPQAVVEKPFKRDPKREVTLHDVARAVQMSVGTVSMSLRGTGRVSAQTRERVRSVAREMGFQPNPIAQRLVSGQRDNSIALFAKYLDLGVITRKIQLLQGLLNNRGYNASIHAFGAPTLGTSEPDDQAQASMMKSLRRMRPRAIVCDAVGLNRSARDELRRYCDEGGVVVCYDTPIDLECDQVLFDRKQNTYMATRHLLELGHRRIGFNMGQVRNHARRLEGLQRALTEYGAPFLAEWLEHPEEPRYEFGDTGVQLASAFLSHSEPPTAMCILNDHVAAGFSAHLFRHGLRVPRDVSVIGHDDMPIAAMMVPAALSTVSHPVEEIAHHTAQLLIERLSGEYEGIPRTIHVTGELIVRQSTAPPHAN
jgi:LacI family transcriptional regulator